MNTTTEWDICPKCGEVRDDLGRCGCDYKRDATSGKEEAKTK